MAPPQAYLASQVAAEQAVGESALPWTVLRFPFVYGDGDGHGHLAALPVHAQTGHWHPAMRMSIIHHRDIATAMHLAFNGVPDGRVVNITDEAPTSVYELVHLHLAGGALRGTAHQPVESAERRFSGA